MLSRALIVIGVAALCCPATASAHDDWRTLTAEVRRAPGPEGWLTLRCGGHEERTALPVTEEWIRITVADRGRHCKTGHRGARRGPRARAVAWAARAVDPRRRRLQPAQVRGLGWRVPHRARAEGRRPRILQGQRLDWIRLRVFVDPADGYHGTRELLVMARRAKRLGIKVLVDLHYSDFWADPGKQWTPAAWEGLSFDDLRVGSPRTPAGDARARAPGHATRHGPARQRDQPGHALGPRGDLDRLLDRGRGLGGAPPCATRSTGTRWPSCSPRAITR